MLSVGDVYQHKDGGLYVPHELKWLTGDWYSMQVVVYSRYNHEKPELFVRTLPHFLKSFTYYRKDSDEDN